MKKILLGLFLLICLFSLVACGNGSEQGGEGGNETGDEYKQYLDELNGALESVIPNEVSENIDLMTEYFFEDGTYASLVWESSNGRTLSAKGKFKQNLFDETITLTASVELLPVELEIYTYEYTKEVVTKGSENLQDYKEIIESYLPDYLYHDIELVVREKTYANKNLFGEITYESKNPDVLTSEGKYVNTNPEDQVVEFCYTVVINGIIIKGSKMITVEGKKDNYYISIAQEYLEEYFKNTDVIYDQLDLPETDDNGRVVITWKSKDLTIFSHEGAILTYEPDKKASLVATISCNEASSTWEKEFSTFKQDDILDFIVNRMHRETVQQYIMKVYCYDAVNNGFLPFYTVDMAMSDVVLSTTANNAKINYLTGSHNQSVSKLNMVTGLKPWGNEGRPATKKTSTDFITIHDTGDGINSATWWNNYVSSGEDRRETSWNFTVGDDVVYQHIPLDEVAWHAGDGSARFGLNDTGIVYDGPNPEITIGKDNYLYINGQKSRIAVPIISGSSKSEYNGKPANYISPAGLYTERGSNGNYYMASVHASNYSQNVYKFYVCTNGGNRNSVGFETCINQGVDYNQVMRNTANIVGHLLVYYDLTPARVLLHQSFSGKLCPQVMIENGLLPNFHNIIENEYIIAKYLEGITFKYESNNPDILSNDGKILKTVTTDTTVSYKVTVSYKGETRTYELSTVIKAK